MKGTLKYREFKYGDIKVLCGQTATALINDTVDVYIERPFQKVRVLSLPMQVYKGYTDSMIAKDAIEEYKPFLPDNEYITSCGHIYDVLNGKENGTSDLILLLLIDKMEGGNGNEAKIFTNLYRLEDFINENPPNDYEQYQATFLNITK